VKRLARRSLLLFGAGLIYSNGFSLAWPDVRLMGVLNRIALVYFFVGLLFCFLKPRTLLAVGIALLTGYWALMTFLPVRNIQLTKQNLAALADQAGETDTAALFRERTNPSRNPNGPAWMAAREMFHATTNRVTAKYDPGLNVSDHLDFQYLPGRKYDNFFDPEGYLSTLPAVVTGLLGVFAGLLLANKSVRDQRKLMLLVSFGLAAIALGWLWNVQFPVIKKLWTSSFVLVAGGYSAILLAAFYWVVDVLRFQRWCQPFVWMGMNSITIYLASKVIDWFSESAWGLIGKDAHAWLEQNIAQGFGQLLTAATSLWLAFGLVYWLYRRRIFLRL
jgi:predicted acyltransferase